MSTARDAVTQAAILRALSVEVGTADKQVRKAVLDALSTGERLNAALPDGTLCGRVRVDDGATYARVDDDAELLAWVALHHPTEVETVRRIRPAFLDKLLADAADKDGAFNPTTGEQIPGVAVKKGDPKVVVVLTAADRAAIGRAWADGSLSLADVIRPALPAGSEAA